MTKQIIAICLCWLSLSAKAQVSAETSENRLDSIVAIVASEFNWNNLNLEKGTKDKLGHLKTKVQNLDILLNLIKAEKNKGDVGALWRIMEIENDSIKELNNKYIDAVAKYNNAENNWTKLQKELEVRLYLERIDSKIFEDDVINIQPSDIPEVWKDKYELISLIREFKKTLDLILEDNKNGTIKDEYKQKIYSLYNNIEGIGLHSLSKEQLQYYNELKKAFNDVI